MAGLIVAVVVAVIAVMCSQVFVTMSPAPRPPISTPRSTPGEYTGYLLFVNYLWIEEYMHTMYTIKMVSCLANWIFFPPLYPAGTIMTSFSSVSQARNHVYSYLQ